jgi:hypothetical protein
MNSIDLHMIQRAAAYLEKYKPNHTHEWSMDQVNEWATILACFKTTADRVASSVQIEVTA